VECVWRTAFTFSPEEFGLARVFISERWFCFASIQQYFARDLVFWMGYGHGVAVGRYGQGCLNFK
jgi:hypothetical protein